MKVSLLTITLFAIVLCSCGGSGEESHTEKSTNNPTNDLANTSWQKTCVPYQDISTGEAQSTWNVNVTLKINSSLESRYKTDFFHPDDTLCNSFMFDTLVISRFEVTSTIISDESIQARGLNETIIYNSENEELVPKYTLVYMNSEKLYFGQASGTNLGKTATTRHTSISLDDYFTQTLN